MEVKNWRTTFLGIVGILNSLGPAVSLLMDGNPSTNPDWNTVATNVALGIGLIFAREQKQHDKENGNSADPKPESKP